MCVSENLSLNSIAVQHSVPSNCRSAKPISNCPQLPDFTHASLRLPHAGHGECSIGVSAGPRFAGHAPTPHFVRIQPTV
ncbi:MAG: hypothetical protein RLZZ519_2344 [Bacteroidota bacterium]|jgi:hypothetical protein